LTFYESSDLDPLTVYYFHVRTDCGNGNLGVWTSVSFKTACLPPNITGTTPGAVCGQGSVELSATADAGTIAWYAAQTGGVALSTGATFNTPVITGTTSYWVGAFQGQNGVGGRLTPASTDGTTPSTYGLVFTATNDFTLNTVDVYLRGTSAGNLVVNLTNNSGTILDTRTIAVPAGNATTPVQHTITLNFNITPGTYRLLAISGPDMVRESALGGYPYPVGDVASITNGYILGTSTAYYYFYNWAYTSGCASPRTEVVATVTTAQPLTLDTTSTEICQEENSNTITITSNVADYDTYVWEPSTGVSGNENTGWTFNPTVTTTYTLTASQTSGAECVATTSFTVLVNPLPTAITAVASTEEACDNSIVELSVTGNIVADTAVFGTGTTAPGTTAWPNPFSAWYGGAKHQMLFTVSELSGQGLTAGSEITAVTFDFATATSGACVDFVIRMGATTLSDLNAGFVSGTINVYGPATYTPSVSGTGVKTFTLTTPYIWDGVSNLVVETVHNAGNGGNGAGTTNRATTTPNNSVYRAAKDNVAGGITGLDSADFTTGTSSQGALNLRPNMTFVYSSEQTLIAWSPATNLYTDENATVAYVADSYSPTVYFKPSGTGNISYTATSYTDQGCSVSSTVEITVNDAPDAPNALSPQTLNEGQTLADLTVTAIGDLTWYSDAGLTNQVSPTTEVVDGTTYYVTQTVGSCTSDATPITVDVNLGNGNFDNVTFKVYPNPTKNILNISCNQDISTIEVYNMVGQRVNNMVLNANAGQIDMSNLASGAYFVKVTSNNATKTVKVIKE
jgi:hypothetical protein